MVRINKTGKLSRKARLLMGATSVVAFGLILVKINSPMQQLPGNTPPSSYKPLEFIYPKTFSLKVLPDGLNPYFGMRKIGNFAGLRGSLCYVSTREISKIAEDKHGVIERGQSVSVFQQVNIGKGKLLRARNFELPAYDTTMIDFIGWPICRDEHRYFVRAAKSGKGDTGECQLYELNLETKKGALENDRLYLYNRLLVSPDKSSYAVETEEPWNEAWYSLTVQRRGSGKVVSKHLVTRTFSWTPRNTLIYPDYARNRYRACDLDDGLDGFVLNTGSENNISYPDIYENDLKGKVKLIKHRGDNPQMSPDGRHLTCFVFYASPENKALAAKNARLNYSRDNEDMALGVYDIRKKEEHIVTVIDEMFPSSHYPHLFWSKDGRKLYVIKTGYTFSEKKAFCHISVYDTRTKKYKLLCNLEQKGESISYEEAVPKLRPDFMPVKLANDRYLLFTVQVKMTGKDKFHVVAVDLSSGTRRDILAATDMSDYYHAGVVDWIDQ